MYYRNMYYRSSSFFRFCKVLTGGAIGNFKKRCDNTEFNIKVKPEALNKARVYLKQ